MTKIGKTGIKVMLNLFQHLNLVPNKYYEEKDYFQIDTNQTYDVWYDDVLETIDLG